MERQFIAYFWFVSWTAISFGFHIDISCPNIEIHLPFGFIRIGWVRYLNIKPSNWDDIKWRIIGLRERYAM